MNLLDRPITTAAQARAFHWLLVAAEVWDVAPHDAALIGARLRECEDFGVAAPQGPSTLPQCVPLTVMGTGGGCEALYRWDAARGLAVLVTNDLAVPYEGETMELGLYADEHYEQCVGWLEGGPAYTTRAHAACFVEAVLAYWHAQ